MLSNKKKVSSLIFELHVNIPDLLSRIGEEMVGLMHKLGFSPSVTWPGYFSLFELQMKVGNMGRAQYYADISYKMVCLAKGLQSKDAQRILMCRNNAQHNINSNGNF